MVYNYNEFVFIWWIEGESVCDDYLMVIFISLKELEWY